MPSATTPPPLPAVTVVEPRVASVGGAPVRRHLPQRLLRTVGPWCFADELGPLEVTSAGGLDVGPHPHTGLQTATWLLEGELLHRDSLGSEQRIVPGQLNLMTAGRGIVHSEEAARRQGRLRAVQLWIAQPESARHGDPGFAHVADVPRVELPSASLTVLAWELLGERSASRHDTELVGVDAQLRAGTTEWPLTRGFEHALIVLDGAVEVEGQRVVAGSMAVLGVARDEVALRATAASRVMLLGGEPLGERLFMWWNFVGRSRDEVAAMHRAWRDGDDRFGPVDTALPRIPAPAPPWETLSASPPGGEA